MNQAQAFELMAIEKPTKSERYKEALRALRMSIGNVARATERLKTRGTNLRPNTKRKKKRAPSRQETPTGGGFSDRDNGAPTV